MGKFDELDRMAVASIPMLLDEITRLRTCLEWYGDEENWGHETTLGGWESCEDGYNVGNAEKDRGSRARAALKGEDK